MSFLTMSADSLWDKALATFVNVKVTITGLLPHSTTSGLAG